MPLAPNPWRYFTPDEDARMEQLRASGMSLRAVAAAIGRPRSSVQMRLEMLAREDGLDDDDGETDGETDDENGETSR